MVAIGAITAVMVVFAAGYGYSATADTNNVYNGCLKSGSISNVTISPAPAPTCGRGAVPISWNQTGPPGQNGTNGTNGVSVTSTALTTGDPHCPDGGSSFTSSNGTTYSCNGADGSDAASNAHLYRHGNVTVPIDVDSSVWTPVITIDDPPVGSYWILASVAVGADGISCDLGANAVNGLDFASMTTGALQIGTGVLTLQGTWTFTAPGGQVRVRCQKLNGGLNVSASANARVTLLSVGSETTSIAPAP
jgi:hypothetical protein